ncbi:gram domain-containing protein 3-like [Plakobranchus ocellatus]|uniref:Gram domain-containing protein 3-like n=1 Tax=Plakobranchus ocellatus TaxID=259542 RepID=A0AAV4CY90_9GAST|nr:gram domain-containing protein 3-like [Plakobranchus ocellatus]
MMDMSVGAAKASTSTSSALLNEPSVSNVASSSSHNQSGSSGSNLHQQAMDTASPPVSATRSDGSPAKKVPDVSDLPYNISKSRTIRFHKLFKSTPVEEYPLESFSCAFKGDILLHGQLYVSHHWACFYSKIKARGRLIEIPFEKIISITREKLALIIPNAIGIQTADQKYVFGSFISRDSTYKKLVTLWKLNQDSTSGTPGMSIELGGSVIGQPTSEDSSESDTTEDDLNNEHQLDRLKRVGSPAGQGHSHRRALVEVDHSVSGSGGKHTDASAAAGGFGTRHTASSQCLNCKSVANSFSFFSVKLQKIPQTNLLLAVCTILVFFLLLSAMGLTYKILLLQSKLEIRNVWAPQASLNFRDRAMSNLYWLQTESHASIVRQLHSVLEANIHLLEEVHMLLQSLYRDPESLKDAK